MKSSLTADLSLHPIVYADLHLHSHFSDGTFTPEEICQEAVKHGLSTVALTDHDTLEGWPRMARACELGGLEFVPGTELTAEHNGTEVHILGYWINGNSPALASRLAGFQAVRVNRIRDMVHRLNERGVPLTAEAVFKIANCRAPGRPHVARALVQEGFCKDFDDAFDRYLKKGRPAWVPKTRMDSEEAINLIHDAGGVAVLAHPGLYKKDEMIPEIAAEGIDGIECWHTKHPPDSAQRYEGLASTLGLAATGGSDCHGMSKGQPLIGRVKVPYQKVVSLKEKRRTPGESGRLSNQN